MAWDIFKFLIGKSTSSKSDIKPVSYELISEYYIRELAFSMMVNRVASAISKCEIMTYENGKKKKSDEWYRWNVQPNKNQNATQFWNKLINRLYNDNQAIIVPVNDELYVADSFFYDETGAFYEHAFKSVVINGFTLDKSFRMSEVFYFKLNDVRIKSLVDGINTFYGKLINAAYANYNASHGNKGLLRIDQFAEGAEDFEETLNEMLNEDFKTFLSSPNAVLPLLRGYDYEALPQTKSVGDTRDIRKLYDDVIEMTAMAFGISKQLAVGEVADTSKAVDDLLTFVIDPLVELISDELNRKLYSKAKYLNGYFVRFNTSLIKHVDLFDVSAAIDKLVSSGCFCIDDIRVALGQEPIDEEWSRQYFMTKNYATIDELLKSMKGGDDNAKDESDEDENAT